MSGAPSEAAWTRALEDEAAVAVLAARFSTCVETPAVIYLEGDLGAGKTTFARAYIHSLGYKGYVKSPSYGLLETYEAGGQNILHLDLYRIEDPEELEYLAIRDLFDARSVLLIEWPDRGKHHLPGPDLVMKFWEKDEFRFVSCFACSAVGKGVADAIADGHC